MSNEHVWEISEKNLHRCTLVTNRLRHPCCCCTHRTSNTRRSRADVGQAKQDKNQADSVQSPVLVEGLGSLQPHPLIILLADLPTRRPLANILFRYHAIMCLFNPLVPGAPKQIGPFRQNQSCALSVFLIFSIIKNDFLHFLSS